MWRASDRKMTQVRRGSLACLLVLPALWFSPLETSRAADCWAGLDDRTLNTLDLTVGDTSVQAGETVYFEIRGRENYYFPVCVEWSISPPGAAIILHVPDIPEEGMPPGSVDATGVLVVGPDLPHGTVVSLSADVDGGRRLLEVQLHVYSPEVNPLVGVWREVARLSCPHFIRGDVDQSGGLELTDAVRIFDFLFLSGEPPGCRESAELNRDGLIDISDGVFILSHLFLGGPYPENSPPQCRPHTLWAPHDCGRFEACKNEGDEQALPVELPMEALAFAADGSFSVRWEDRSGFRGVYDFDWNSGAMSFEIESGLYIPRDFHCVDCRFVIQDDELRFEDLWFGTPRDDEVEIGCGHRFRRLVW